MPELTTLPPFSGHSTTCAKCGRHAQHEVTYLADGWCTHAGQDSAVVNIMGGDAGQERLHRSCTTCGYTWDEATVGAGRDTNPD